MISVDPPKNSGTEVCDHNAPSPREGDYICESVDKNANIKREFFKDPQNLLKRYKYSRIMKKVNSYFDPIVKVPNKFNRMILFPGNNFHRAQRYFGTSIGNARLILISFLK